MVNFRPYDRSQQLLLPPDLRDWVPEDDLAHFIIEAVERVGLGAFKVNWAGTGKAQYHPRLMLALLIYCYANGIFSLRRIERVEEERPAYEEKKRKHEARNGQGRPLKKPDDTPPPEIKAEWRQQMQARMQTEAAKAKYKRRQCTVEPVFGIIKNVLGFTRFHLRVIDDVRAEWLLVTLAYNCKRPVNLKAA